jgi:hypothetical protein
MLSAAAQFPWIWTLTATTRTGHRTHGDEATREAAMLAFAKSCHRET